MVLASLIEVFIEQPFHDVGGRVRMPDAKGVGRSRASRPVAKDSCVHAHSRLTIENPLRKITPFALRDLADTTPKVGREHRRSESEQIGAEEAAATKLPPRDAIPEHVCDHERIGLVSGHVIMQPRYRPRQKVDVGMQEEHRRVGTPHVSGVGDREQVPATVAFRVVCRMDERARRMWILGHKSQECRPIHSYIIAKNEKIRRPHQV